MDEFEKRLKRDAYAIQAEVPPELRTRIDASLSGVEPVRTVPAERSAPATLWWASSLTGLTAVVVLVVLVNFNKPDPGPIPENTLASQTEPPVPVDFTIISPNLDIRSADFTMPL